MISKEDSNTSLGDELTVPDICDLTCAETLETEEAMYTTDDSESFLASLDKDAFDEIFDDNVDIILASDLPITEAKPDYILQPQKRSYYEVKKKGTFPTTAYHDYRDTKHQLMMFHRTELKNGFYTGFVSTVVCYQCEAVLDTYPSLSKSVYWVPKEKCIYCNKRRRRFTQRDMIMCEAVYKNFPKKEHMHHWLK